MTGVIFRPCGSMLVYACFVSVNRYVAAANLGFIYPRLAVQYIYDSSLEDLFVNIYYSSYPLRGESTQY